MKKMYIGEHGKSSDALDTTGRLYRSINEIAKKLEEQKGHALTVVDIFTPAGEALRSKLRDYCQKVIINHPVNYQKTEELLWRKGFYDIVSTAKKLKKNNSWSELEKAYLSTHLLVGIGFYHHLILRLHQEFNIKLIGVIDFVYLPNQKSTNHAKNIKSPKVISAEVKKCVIRLIHRSLICLGDLERYRLDIDPDWDPQIASRYYKMAIAVDMRYGMPYNQLASVAGNKNYGLDAVYYYMRSTLCAEPFDLAEGNLKRTIAFHSLNGKEKCVTQTCIARLLLLLQLWDNSNVGLDRINQESQILLSDIENSLNVEKSENIDYKSAENEIAFEKYFSHFKNTDITYLTDDMIFKIIIICLMKTIKLQSKEIHEIHGIIAFVLAVFSQLLQFVVMRLQESLLDLSQNNNEENCEVQNNEQNDSENTLEGDTIQNNHNNQETIVNTENEVNGNHVNGKEKKTRGKSKNLLTKLRRRRNRKNSSDSDISYEDELGSTSEEINSDMSDTEEEIMSDENILSDEALSEDASEDENNSTEKTIEKKDEEINSVNGHISNGEKFIEENENEVDATTTNNTHIETENTDETNTFDENSPSANTLTLVAQKEKQSLDPIKVLKVLSEEKMLISIKICCDWLHGQQNIIKTCAKGSKSLLKRLITLINLINIDSDKFFKKINKTLEIFYCKDKVKEIVDSVPLPEDIDLRGLQIFENAHSTIDWDILRMKKMTHLEETFLRALKIVKFGHYLCSIPESEVTYDEKKSLFILNCKDSDKLKENEEIKTFEIDNSKSKLMRHMGKLWLKAEVRALESRLHQRLMSPYLVPDHDAFSKYMPIVKHLVYAKKFIVVIPSIVISALDELKRTSSHAREATRWIENQLKRGSRFLRPQRPHEKLPIPFVKGPKPKDKEAWLYFHIVECCHYLTQQSQAGDTEIPVVTLLTGSNDKKLISVNPEGLAKSAGVNFEHIGAFHAKWKLSIKSHG